MPLKRISILHQVNLGLLLLAGGLCLCTPRYAAPADLSGDHVCAGSGCLGVGVETFTNGEELKLKDTVPILRFEDTDTGNPPSVPPDTIWQLEANNGTQKFSLVDKTNSKTPFSVGANAPNNALYISPNGRIGMGTSTPLGSLHLATAGTPGVVFDQINTGYSWRISGTDQGFFLNDGFSGFAPFGIAAGAPANSIIVAPSGNVGFKTNSPQSNLHIYGTANADVFNGIGPEPQFNGTLGAFNFGYSGATYGLGSGFFNVRPAAGAVAPNPSLRFATANVQRMIITNTGKVGIGTLSPSEALEVQGNIRANGSFRSNGTTLNVPDYVFEPDYKLMPLPALASYVEKEKHLPDIPSAQEIKEQGVNMSELQMQLLKKVEELTLYTITQEQTITTQAQTINQLRDVLTDLTARLTVLEQAREAERPASKDTRHATQHRP